MWPRPAEPIPVWRTGRLTGQGVRRWSWLHLWQCLGEVLGEDRDRVRDGEDFLTVPAHGLNQRPDRRLVGLLQPDVLIELLRRRDNRLVGSFQLLVLLFEARHR